MNRVSVKRSKGKRVPGRKTDEEKTILFCSVRYALCALLSVGAQQAGKVHRIGYLSVRKPDTEKSYLPAFQQGLRELGYVEGKNIVIEYRWAERRGMERVSALAAEPAVETDPGHVLTNCQQNPSKSLLL